MMDALGYEFFQRALAAGLLAAVASGIVGTFVVARRIASISGGLAHAAFGGIGLGYLVGMGLEQQKSIADLLLHIVGLVLLIVLASLLLGWWTRYRAWHIRPPRAKASWLRRFRKRSRRTAAAPSTNAHIGENKSENAAV